MANVYNPYGIATTEQGLLENLLASDQAKTKGALATDEKKGKMKKDFQEEYQASQKEQERLLQKRRKKKLWEKLLPVAGMFLGPLASGIIGGLQGMYTARQDQKFRRGHISGARAAGLQDKWDNTFLGNQAMEIKGESDTMLDELRRKTSLSGLDFTKTGILGGIEGWTSGKLGDGIKEGIKAAKVAPKLKDVDLSEIVVDDSGNLVSGSTDEQIAALGKGQKFGGTSVFKNKTADYTREELMRIQNVLGDSKMPGLKAVFGEMGLGKDPTTLLEEGGEGSNVLKNLLLLLSQQGLKEVK